MWRAIQAREVKAGDTIVDDQMLRFLWRTGIEALVVATAVSDNEGVILYIEAGKQSIPLLYASDELVRVQ